MNKILGEYITNSFYGFIGPEMCLLFTELFHGLHEYHPRFGFLCEFLRHGQEKSYEEFEICSPNGCEENRSNRV